MKKYLDDSTKQPQTATASPLHKTQRISFKLFQQKETVHLKSLYPFLTKTQINCKVREQWKQLSPAEKQNYSKTVLTKTPTKSPTNSRKTKKSSSSRAKCSIWKDKSISSPQTPGYKSDFPSPSPKLRKNEKYQSWLKNPSNVEEVQRDYSKTKYSTESEVVPNVIDETPSKQAGILKQKELTGYDDALPKTKNRVSFPLEEDTRQSGEITGDKIKDTEQESQEDSPSYSSDEDGTLIRRNTSKICNFDDINEYQMYIEGEENETMAMLQNEIIENIEPNEKPLEMKSFSGSQDQKQVSSQNESYEGKDPLNTRGKKKQSKAKSKKITPEILQTKITRSTPRLKSDDKKFKTPMVVNKNPEGKTDKYTTPMMDDATMEQLIEQAKEAPKKRPTRGKKLEEIEEAAISEDKAKKKQKQKVRTSLISMKTEATEEEDFVIDASGDAKIYVAEPLYPTQQHVNDTEVNTCTDDNELLVKESDTDDGIDIFPSSIPFFRVPDPPEIDDEVLDESDFTDDEFEACKSTSNSTLMKTLQQMKAATLMGTNSPAERSPEISPKILSPALSGISQLSSASSESHVSSPTKDTSNNLNDVSTHKKRGNNRKRKATTSQNSEAESDQINNNKKGTAKSLRTSSQESFSKNSTIDKKKERNNGKTKLNVVEKVEQIMTDQKNGDVEVKDPEYEKDLLSECTESNQVMLDQNGNVNDLKSHALRKKITRIASKRKSPQPINMVTEQPLCDLFYDMTPPEEKQRKQSNRRLLASAVHHGRSDIKSFFNADSDAIF